MRVLVVDDSRPVRMRIVARLREIAGVDVVWEATDGAEAIARARELGPDAVFLDLEMPGTSGLEAIPALKAGDRPPIVVVLTNHATPAYRSRCLSLGADHFFDKAIDLERAADVLAALAHRT